MIYDKFRVDAEKQLRNAINKKYSVPKTHRVIYSDIKLAVIDAYATWLFNEALQQT